MTKISNTKTILIADSYTANIGLIGKRLKQEGYNILTAVDGKQAISIAEVKSPDLIILDEDIPVINSTIVQRTLKRQNPSTLFIILSDVDSINAENEIIDEEYSIFIEKPIDIEALTDATNQLLFNKTNHLKSDPSDSKNKTKVLLVEDNELNQIFISELLKDLSFEVDVAHDGEIALNKFLGNSYSLILMDVNIPIIDGIQLTEIIRIHHKSNIPIIAITGHFEQEVIDRCKSAGMNSFLNKPFEASKFNATITKLLEGSEQPSALGKPKNYPEHSKYDYNHAMKLAGGDEELFQKWLVRFLGLVKTAQEFVNHSLDNGDFSQRNKVFHELINYSGYFGVDDLRIYIKELQSIQKFTTDSKRLENFFRKIKTELDEIELFFGNLIQANS